MTYQEKVYESYASASGLDRPLQSKYQSLAHNLSKHLLSVGQGKLLDIGSGQGELLMLCQSLGLQAEGVDISRELTDDCNRRGLNVTLISDLQQFLTMATNQWSAICMIDVLEHFTKADAFDILGKIRVHALRPGGKMIIQVPNMQSLFAPLNLYHDITHEWAYTETSIAQMLRTVGFKRIQVYPSNYPLKGANIPRHILRSVLYSLVRMVLIIDQPNRGSILTPNLIAVAES